MLSERVTKLIAEWEAGLGVSHEDAADIARALLPELARLQGIVDRPLDDDLNVLWHRCKDQEPLSLAEQRELYDWLQEKDVVMGDQGERIVALEAIVDKLPKTADGVPVVPGMDVWCKDAVSHPRSTVGCYQWHVKNVDFRGLISGTFHNVSEGPHDASACYSTRQAAEAAAKEK